MKSKAASQAAAAASLAESLHLHCGAGGSIGGATGGGLFGASGGQGSAASLLASHPLPHHLASGYGGGGAVPATSAAQQILNYAAAAAQLSGGGSGSCSTNNSKTGNSSGLLQEVTGGGGANPGNWDPNTMALQMSQLFGANPSLAAAANPETLAQLNAASQLIAASLLQQQTKDSLSSESISSHSSRKSKQNQNNSSNNSPLLCSICGQVSRDPSDYEQHLMTHISLLSANQNAYYGLNFLRMQNLFNGSSGGGAATNGTSGAIPGSTVPNGTNSSSSASASTASSSSSSTIMNKKRKLLAKHQADSLEQELESLKKSRSEGLASDYDSLSRLGLENLLKGTMPTAEGGNSSDHQLMVAQQAQNLLAQFAQQANSKHNGPLASPTGPNTSGSTATNTNTTCTNSLGSNNTTSTAFPCTSCHKTFATEVDLKAHLLRHLTQHPFLCNSCGKGFKYEHSLNFHIKSYHSGNGNASANASNETNGGEGTGKNGSKGGKAFDSEGGLLKLKKNRNSSTTVRDSLDFEDDEFPEPKTILSLPKLSSPNPSLTIPTSTTSCSSANANSSSSSTAATSLLHSRLTLMDENHNAMGTATHAAASALSLLGSPTGSATSGDRKFVGSEFPFFFGKPPTNLPPDSPVQIRSEKLLISILDAVNVATDQSLIFYKCCLCCVAFASLDQMSIHIQNVHLPPGAAACGGAAELFINSGALLGLGLEPRKEGTGITSTASSASSGQQQFSCDKCSAKFSASPEYEVHMQLHRTLEGAGGGGGLPGVVPGAGSAAGSLAALQYPFNLLSQLHSGVLTPNSYPAAGGQGTPTAPSNPAAVDFRQILANASKDTDFGRKFAAQLLQESTKDHLASLDPYHTSAQHHHHHRNAKSLFHDAFSDRGCSPPSTPASHTKLSPGASSGGGGAHPANDPNNNSLLYLSLLPEHAKPPNSSSSSGMGNESRSSRFNNSKVDSSNSAILNLSNSEKQSSRNTPEKVSRKARGGTGSDSSGKSSASSNGSTLRHIKEPVDIFEGAGQSLPIQKFPIGDIEETAPGQFKCRFCDKTFDRVFSVHRHERVHTGFKPCICKTCGRGFSEKRNLRHHIIRFHSDGSGRELLKRKRKPKSGGSMFINGHGELSGDSMSLLRGDSIMSSLLGGGGGANGGSGSGRRGSRNSGSAVPDSLFNAFRQCSSAAAVASATGMNGGSLSNLKLSLAEMDQLKGHFGMGGGGGPMNLSNGSGSAAGQRPTSGSSSSSRRRKSKPSRKVYADDEEDDDLMDDDRSSNNKKEMLVVDVDVVPLVTEEDEDDQDDEDDDLLDDDMDEEDLDEIEDDIEELDEDEETSEDLSTTANHHKATKQQLKQELDQAIRVKKETENIPNSDDGDETEEEQEFHIKPESEIKQEVSDQQEPDNNQQDQELPETVKKLNSSTNSDDDDDDEDAKELKIQTESDESEEINSEDESELKLKKKANNKPNGRKLKRKSK